MTSFNTCTHTRKHANTAHCRTAPTRFANVLKSKQPWINSESHKSWEWRGDVGRGEGQGQCVSSRGQKVNCRALPPGPFIIPLTQTDYTTHTAQLPPHHHLTNTFPPPSIAYVCSPSSLTWSSLALFPAHSSPLLDFFFLVVLCFLFVAALALLLASANQISGLWPFNNVWALPPSVQPIFYSFLCSSRPCHFSSCHLALCRRDVSTHSTAWAYLGLKFSAFSLL